MLAGLFFGLVRRYRVLFCVCCVVVYIFGVGV